MDVKEKRPKVLEGPTYEKTTGCGHLYVTVNSNENGKKPLEVFLRLGKNGDCTRSQNEALARAISLGLKYGVPIEEFVKQLKGIQCNNPSLWPEIDRTLSCSDAVGKALEEFVSENP